MLPQKLPEVLIPKILTWVGYDLIEDKPIKPLRHSTRNRDPVYTGQKTIGGTAPKRSAPLVRVGTELRFELIAKPALASHVHGERAVRVMGADAASYSFGLRRPRRPRSSQAVDATRFVGPAQATSSRSRN